MTTANRFETFNMTLPPEGPSAIPVVLNFTESDGEQEIDLTEAINNGLVSYISGVFVEAFDTTAGSLEIEINAIGQRIRVAANSFATFPLPVPNPPKFKARSIDGFDGIARLHFVNFPLWPFASNSGGGSAGAVTGPTITDYSMELTGDNDFPFSPGDAARYLFIFNPIDGNGQISVNLTGADASVYGMSIAEGGSFELAGGLANEISIVGSGGKTVIVFGGA
jgi:hypothetical protein